jgi:hypothetical protein
MRKEEFIFNIIEKDLKMKISDVYMEEGKSV